MGEVDTRLEAIAVALVPWVYGTLPVALVGVALLALLRAPFPLMALGTAGIAFGMLSLLILMLAQGVARARENDKTRVVYGRHIRILVVGTLLLGCETALLGGFATVS